MRLQGLQVADEPETEEMNVSERAKKAGWNINSSLVVIMGLISVGSSVGTAVWVTANKSRDIEELQSWKVQHEAQIKDRQIANEKITTELKTILDNSTARITTAESDIKMLTLRMSANEQSVGQVLSSVKELTASVNDVSSDMKVVRAILQGRSPGRDALLK